MAYRKQPLSNEQALTAIRMVYEVIGPLAYSEKLAASRKMKWICWDIEKLTVLSEKLDKLGIEHTVHLPTYSSGCKGISFHVPKNIRASEAMNGLYKRKPPTKRNIPKQVLTYVSRETIVKKLMPYVQPDDDYLSLIELTQVIHARVKEDLS